MIKKKTQIKKIATIKKMEHNGLNLLKIKIPPHEGRRIIIISAIISLVSCFILSSLSIDVVYSGIFVSYYLISKVAYYGGYKTKP